VYQIQPANSCTIPPTVDTNYANWNGSIWVDGRNAEEQLINTIQEEKAKQKQRINDGIDSVASMTAEFNVMVTLGYISHEANIASHNALKSIRAEVISGSWDKASIELELVDKVVIGEPLYNRLRGQIDDYILNNY
jgi:hypothetical protein